MATQTLVSIPAGEDVLDGLRGVDFGHDGWVQGVGDIENAELRVAGEGRDPRRVVRGRATVLSLCGPASGPYMVTLAQATPDGIGVSGGALLHGVSCGLQLVVLDAAPLGAGVTERSLEPEPTAPPVPPAAGGAAAGPDAKPAPTGWAAVATATAVLEAAPAPVEKQVPARGDCVQHFKFGLCDVVKVQDRRITVRDVNGPGRFREISLAHVEIEPPKERDGKRVFPLKRRSA